MVVGRGDTRVGQQGGELVERRNLRRAGPRQLLFDALHHAFRKDAPDRADDAIAIGLGGFLGIGERQVAYPLDQISFQRTAAGDLEAYVGTPVDQIQNLPPYAAN